MKSPDSQTGDAGCETGGGASCLGNRGTNKKQSFLGYMIYNRFWFQKDRYGLTLGGGQINNPGRYLGLAAAHQWRDRRFWHAILHPEPRRSI